MRLTRTLILFLSVVTLIVPEAAASQAGFATAGPPAELAGLDTYIERARATWNVPGLAIAVVRNDSVVYEAGFGERTVGTGEPVDENTLFAIASTTKAFTVAGLGMLVDEGVLDWDDRVADYLPGFELGDAYVSHNVRIRDLLTHRTGVSRSDNIWIAGPFDRAEILHRARFLPQVHGFRYGYSYNNIMYMVAGEVLASAAGMPWASFLEGRILGPLGMDRTTPRMAVVRERDNVAGSHTWGGGHVINVPHRDYDALGPAGSVFSSAHEMAQWVRLHLDNGVYEGQRLLDSATIAEMHAPQMVIPIDSVRQRMFPSNHFRAYGLAWRLEDHHGYKIVQHTGAVNLMRTQVGLIPEAGIGFVAMTNLTSSELQTALMYRVFDALLGIPETDWSAEYLELERRAGVRSNERAAERAASRIRGTKPSLDLDAYAGTYADSLFGEVRIEREGDGLVLRYSPEYVADLRHWHFDTFRAVWRRADEGPDFVTFTLDERGRVRDLTLEGFTTFGRVRDRDDGSGS